MNSSESEEDFESADEDLEHDNQIGNKKEDEVVKMAVDKESSKSVINKRNEKNTSETTPFVEKVEQLQNVISNEESLSSGSKLESQTETEQDKDPKSINVPTHTSEGTKNIPLVKKLGAKLTDKISDVQQIEGGTSSQKEDRNRTNNQQKKIKPMKLGTKLSGLPKGSKTKVDVDSDAEEINNLKIEDCIKTGESSCQGNALESIVKETQHFLLSEETNLEKGDGWEVEEEDGFEIPATLAKTVDSGIKCPQEQVCESDQVKLRLPAAEDEQGWGGWGGWGVSSLLSTASGTVTTFSSHVTAGLSTVIETTVGAPDPASLVGEQASQKEEKEQSAKGEVEEVPGYRGLGSIMSGVSFLGSSVINRGLDTLETIGKKTMEVLQEGDPGLKKKRAMLFLNEDKPILSQILREAKDRADNSDKEKEEKEAARKIHFESLFDDFQGMVHLEALEMLSTQSKLKLQTLLQSHSGSQLQDLQETLSQVQDLCELTEEEEDVEVLTDQQFAELVSKCFEGLKIKMAPNKIIMVSDAISVRLEQQHQQPTSVHQAAILSLAELTAAAMEGFHKSAELVMAKSIHNTADEADSYVQLTYHLCARVSSVANKFTQLLTKNDPIANSSLITNIFLEASNSCSYIKNACQLLTPILQEGALAS